MRRPGIRTTVSTAAAVLAACASTPKLTAPDVPPALRTPAGQTVFLEALATGVQIYECAPKKEQADQYEWAFRAPEATLVDRGSKRLGRHYGGPTWESIDGSKVVGEVKGRDPGPDPAAIPWLLLAAKSTSGNGVFTPTASIQRVRTTGGIAPAQPCGAENVGRMARVPYTASYYFYRAAQ
ncbi:MAG TPA: DUF3455 domain-containing protein [Burkholderiaceae bacterium]|nr:DUF3455 domain-containing protein [Burkholderiaceae bacterium]